MSRLISLLPVILAAQVAYPASASEVPAIAGLASAAGAKSDGSGEATYASVPWKRIQLDETFRSEGVAAADLNRDGKTDVVAGDVWYEAPDWTLHEIRPVGAYAPEKGYSRSFANFTWDINGDGWGDVIVIGFPGAPVHWYENPRGEYGDHWAEHLIWHSACNETPDFEDITGDGKPELILGSQPERQMGYLPLPDPQNATEKWDFHPISEPGKPSENGTHRFYHGLGVGDVNRDGRPDVLIPHGWWQAPDDPTDSPWTFHATPLSRPEEKTPLRAANIYVDDLDGDGDSDVIMTSAHSYGVWWFENTGGNEKPEFTYHLIDESYSQTHAVEFVDIDGDGQRDIVTGKRYFAHQGKDPGGKEPVGMYWYEIRKRNGAPPKFLRHEIAAGRDTGVGTQFVVTDFDGDGSPDIVLSNKKGVNLLLQVRQ